MPKPKALTSRQVIAVLGCKDSDRPGGKKRDYSSRDLAARLGVSRGTIMNIWTRRCYKDLYDRVHGKPE